MIQKLIKPHLKSFMPYSSARDTYKGNGILLDANESPDDSGKLNRYPDPSATKLVELISRKNGIANGEVLISSGSDEAYDLIFKLIISEGDNVLAFKPSYGMYKVLSDLYGANYNEIQLKEDFSIPELSDEILRQSKLLIICRPNNPTGNIFTKKTVMNLIERFNGMVVIDEAYIDFNINETLIKEIKNFPNLLVTRTFSKAYALAAARVGYVIGNESIISYLKAIKLPYNISSLSVDAAYTSLIEEKTVVPSILREREIMYGQLQSFSFIERVYPSESNFILMRVKNANHFYNYCFKNDLILRKIRSVEEGIRVSIGSKKENDVFIGLCKSYEEI